MKYTEKYEQCTGIVKYRIVKKNYSDKKKNKKRVFAIPSHIKLYIT